MPARQAVHTADVLAEAAVPYSPAEHAVHTSDVLAPAWSLYSPAAQPPVQLAAK